uniref:Uncharacterized protein n=1 Tax=Neobodo designis TaxID=312471 RepID=A0A7S1MIX8_NEODS|mmetsp:Transcript_41539/g.128352  ORF Transcript_41539/g.128352 Transcript_41539/m.128352 type:complete len:191 (+) Transcript_41539:144-716(+)|eukprot:CAMPEP_0174838140 /NCGR_PEP_ID=MMETSP1114-20130205/7214_1 /TAXON_ID=312471 /ORGANISM="Neobodo designis, Strain CCAP 1951/1" /LENGTH=190 /DNA_ID=CAMNT_0016072235 /DNA_START=141 /DNA_END=713 /DNA_ORIENTATION=-
MGSACSASAGSPSCANALSSPRDSVHAHGRALRYKNNNTVATGSDHGLATIGSGVVDLPSPLPAAMGGFDEADGTPRRRRRNRRASSVASGASMLPPNALLDIAACGSPFASAGGAFADDGDDAAPALLVSGHDPCPSAWMVFERSDDTQRARLTRDAVAAFDAVDGADGSGDSLEGGLPPPRTRSSPRH